MLYGYILVWYVIVSSVIQSIAFVAKNSACAHTKSTADMIIIVFFYLLRAGEYTSSPSDTQPFDYKSVQLFCGGRRLDLTTASNAEILTATFASLTFDLQKNGVRGEVIGQGLSGHPDVCPVKALARRVIHLRQFNAPPPTPLAMTYVRNAWMPITPSHIFKTIKQAVTFLGPELGFLPSEISARCS